jgi:hypothetical protein
LQDDADALDIAMRFRFLSGFQGASLENGLTALRNRIWTCWQLRSWHGLIFHKAVAA